MGSTLKIRSVLWTSSKDPSTTLFFWANVIDFNRISFHDLLVSIFSS